MLFVPRTIAVKHSTDGIVRQFDFRTLCWPQDWWLMKSSTIAGTGRYNCPSCIMPHCILSILFVHAKTVQHTHPVEVGVRVLWHVIVEDNVDPLNVDPPAKEIRGAQDALAEGFEGLVFWQPVQKGMYNGNCFPSCHLLFEWCTVWQRAYLP